MPNFEKSYDFPAGEILLLRKEQNWTSFDVVNKIRYHLCKKLGIKKLKVGHAGTLDPLATGLIILCTGKATKKIEEIQQHEKEYVATLKIGATTPSFDLETEENASFDYKHITRKLLEKTLLDFIGETEQIPPVFSAVKVKGKRAFDYARKGEKIKLSPKKIIIHNIIIEDFDLPTVKIRVKCGKGTYIRALARDIGEKLNCGAYLTSLERTQIGPHKIEHAVEVEHFLKELNITSSIQKTSSEANG